MNLDDMLKKSYGKKIQSADTEKKVVQPVVWETLASDFPADSQQKRESQSITERTKHTISPVQTIGTKVAATAANDSTATIPPDSDGFLKTGIPHPSSSQEKYPYIPSANQSQVEKGGGTFIKVAKFLMLIGVDEAAKILEKLPTDQVEKIALELAYMRDIPPEEASSILEEFGELAQRAQYTPSGGVDTARSILDRAFGSEQGEQLLRKAVPDIDGKPFDFITELDSEKLSFLLQGESAAVQAIVLSKIPPALAAKHINSMSQQLRTDIILRLGRMQKIERSIVQRIDRVMREKDAGFTAGRSEQFDGRTVLAHILNTADYDKSSLIINSLKNSNSDLAADIEHRMFSCDRIPGCFGRGFQELISGMTDTDLALLLHGKTADFRNTILENLSGNRSKDVVSLLDIMTERKDTFAQSSSITGSFLQQVRRGLSDGTIFDQNSKIIRA